MAKLYQCIYNFSIKFILWRIKLININSRLIFGSPYVIVEYVSRVSLRAEVARNCFHLNFPLNK